MPFSCVLPADYHRLRVGGLILAAVLCLIGIMILLSKIENTHARAHVILPFLEPAKALLCPAIKKSSILLLLLCQVADAGASSTRTRGNIKITVFGRQISSDPHSMLLSLTLQEEDRRKCSTHALRPR